jgi:peptidoglycan hydrolase-like protein with peptidoglycan-binding domain
MAEMQRVEVGDQGEWVEYLQQVLESHGYSPDTSDNVFTESLAAVVRQYQADHGLVEDGVVDERTWAALVPAEEADQSIEIDWSQLPWLSALAQYDATEDGARQFLVDNDVRVDLLAPQD